MTAGAVAGMFYNFIFYPADTIKSRMQTEDISQIIGGRRTFGAAGKALWKQHGIKGLYRGCGITVGRAAPSSAFIFTIYEELRRRFE
jgi:ornithine carrier protein